MNTTEHLQRIRARCVELLALAEKRTPGKWISSNASDVFTDTEEAKRGFQGHHIADCDPSSDKLIETARTDARFVAACAGAAEAGWWSTIAAIDVCTELPSPDSSLILSKIRAAWPEELL